MTVDSFLRTDFIQAQGGKGANELSHQLVCRSVLRSGMKSIANPAVEERVNSLKECLHGQVEFERLS